MINFLTNLKNFKFINPQYFDLFYVVYVLILLAFFIGGVSYLNRVKRSVGSRHCLTGKIRFWIFMILGLSASVFALTRPYLPSGSAQLRKGSVEVVVILDNSASMWARDIIPSRIDIATREITNAYSRGFIRKGDKTALVLFGSTTIKRLKLSVDIERFAQEVSKVGRPITLMGSYSPWGSNVSTVLEETLRFLDRQDGYSDKQTNWRPSKKLNRIILFFGDGDYEFNDKKRIEKSVAEFNKRGLKIFSVGIGTRNPTRLDSVLNGYVEGVDYDRKTLEDIKDLKTSLNITTLDFLARSTGGQMMTIENEEGSSEEFLANAINSNRDSSLGFESVDSKKEFWPEFLELALLLFIAGFILK